MDTSKGSEEYSGEEEEYLLEGLEELSTISTNLDEQFSPYKNSNGNVFGKLGESISSENIEENDDEEEDVNLSSAYMPSEKGFYLSVKPKISKHTFQLKQKENGNILTVHHTVEEGGKIIRIRMAAFCFSARDSQFITIDKRGNIFVFDLVSKRYWKLNILVPRTCIIVQSLNHQRHFFIGTKLGKLLLVDIDKSTVLNSTYISEDPILEITFPGKPLKPLKLMLIHIKQETVLFDVQKFTPTYRLDIDEVRFSLKFASFIPFSENIFTCFTNDSVHIWSSTTLNTLQVIYPCKSRNRKIRLLGEDKIPKFTISSESDKEFEIKCNDRDYSDGSIMAYAFSADGLSICLSTLDSYLLLYSAYTFDLQNIAILRDFVLDECVFLQKPKECLILGLTTRSQVVLLDIQRNELKMFIQSMADHLSISADGKLLAVSLKSGEIDIWSTCRIYNTLKAQEKCIELLKSAFQQTKPVTLGSGTGNQCFNASLRRLLKPERLLCILREFGCYPAKYRLLIWCALLKLPSNYSEYQQLLTMKTPSIVKQRCYKLRMKQELMTQTLLKVWSCLANWCRVFAHSEFIPHLIFPFVKLFSKNTLVAFELCATLLTNHFQLWFEFHPLEPSNYLGICENILQHFDSKLCKFYSTMHITSKEYAWSLLSNGFSEVYDEEQWLCLWDNIISMPSYFPIYCCIAYNILQREVILRLPDKRAIVQFFHEQNPVNICKVLSRAYCLMEKCPATLNPQRYMKEFEAIPKNVYPKFLNYPHEWLMVHDKAVEQLEKENCVIDARIRNLELEECRMLECLEKGLKDEEHAKRMKQMEQIYQDTLKREEERIACQRKLLLVYQKEVRNRKGEVLATLQECDRRTKAIQLETELDSLKGGIERERLRHDTKLILAEDEIRNQDLELMTQRYFVNTPQRSLTQKYQADIIKMCKERQELSDKLNMIALHPSSIPNPPLTQAPNRNIDDIEKKIEEIQKEFQRLMKKC